MQATRTVQQESAEDIFFGQIVIICARWFLILAGIASGKIDISALLAESGGGASMSRFQLLIFTFVIGISFFLVVVVKNDLPEVPKTVLALLGISAGTYGVSKGIQAASGLPGKSVAGNPDESTPPSNKPSGS